MLKITTYKLGLLGALCLLSVGCATPGGGGAAPAGGAGAAAGATGAATAAGAGGAGTGAAGAGAAGAGAAGAGAAPAAGGKHAALKAKLQNCFLVKLAKEFLKPFTGGGAGQNPGGLTMPTDEELKAPGAQGTAAKIKKETIEAKKRQAAVKFLGTVDCHYYPEAAASLIAALRTDRTECVRLEAAKALGKGCCCTKEVIEALARTVSGAEDDGNPAETSPRVREAARVALQRCLACYSKVEPVKKDSDPKKPEEPKKPDAPAAVQQTSFAVTYPVADSSNVVFARARHTLQVVEDRKASRRVPTPHNGLFGLFFQID